jgi:hypothetical protein
MKITLSKNLKVATYISLSLLIAMFLLYAVFFLIPQPKPIFDDYKINRFFADTGEVALLFIGDEVDIQKLDKILEQHDVYLNFSHGYSYDDSLESLNKKLPELDIESKPAYYVFDSKELIYKTYKYDDLVQYLVDYSN